MIKEDSDKVMAEKDPLNPENDIFWEGPGAIRPSLQKAAAEAKAKAEAEPRPYSLNPKPTILGNILSNIFVCYIVVFVLRNGRPHPSHNSPMEVNLQVYRFLTGLYGMWSYMKMPLFQVHIFTGRCVEMTTMIML